MHDTSQVGRGRAPVPCRGSGQRCRAQSQRAGDGLGEVLRERHVGCGFDERRRPLDADVGVDAPRAGRGRPHRPFRRVAGRVGEEVSQRRAGHDLLVGRVIEVHCLFLDRDENRQCCERFRDRREVELVIDGPTDLEHPGSSDDRRRNSLDRPVVDELERHKLRRARASSISRGTSGATPSGSRSHGNHCRSTDSSLTCSWPSSDATAT